MLLKLGSAATLAFLIGALVGVAPVAAQSSSAAQEPVGTTGTVQPQVDASKLGVDIARVRRQLVRVTVREERDGMKLRYAVDVFGMAPPIDLFPSARIDPNYFNGPVPYGAPSHREFIDLNTPIEHRNYPADVGALFRWLNEKTTREKNKPKR
jgi:hypothetical protein